MGEELIGGTSTDTQNPYFFENGGLKKKVALDGRRDSDASKRKEIEFKRGLGNSACAIRAGQPSTSTGGTTGAFCQRKGIVFNEENRVGGSNMTS
jgi:hypothetical protein